MHVNCPACQAECSLLPLHRAGAYRLVDADGGTHLSVCQDLQKRLVPIRRYQQRAVRFRMPEMHGVVRFRVPA